MLFRSEAAGDLTTAKILATRASAEKGLPEPAKQAMARKVGARGLRMILEELMLDLMYHLPSQKKVKEFEVTRKMVEKRNVTLAMMDKAG